MGPLAERAGAAPGGIAAWEASAVGAATLLGAVIRAHHLDYPAFWLDEYATFAYVSESWSRFFGPDVRAETNPPLFYLLQKAWLVFGSSRTAMRSLPLLLGSLCVPVAFLLGRRFGGARVGVITAFLLATAPLFIHYSREIRSYSLVFLASGTSLVCLARLLPDRFFVADGVPASPRTRRALWCVYVLATTVALYAHNTLVLLPALATGLVFGLGLRGDVDRRFLRDWTLANAAVLAAYAFWLPVILWQSQNTMHGFWIQEPTFHSVKSNLMGVYPYPKWTKPVMYALALPGLWMLRRRPAALAFVLVFLVGQPLLTYAISHYHSIFVRRVLVWPSVFYLVLVALSLSRLRRPPLCAAAVAAFAAVQLVSARADYPESRRPDLLSPLVSRLDYRPETDVLVFAPQILEWQYKYVTRDTGPALEGYGINYGDSPREPHPWMRTRLTLRGELLSRLGGAERIWLFFEHSPRFPIPPEDGVDGLRRALDASWEKGGSWRGAHVELALYARPHRPQGRAHDGRD